MEAFASLLAPERVRLGVRARDKSALLELLAAQAARELSIPEGIIAAALQERERLGSTGLGNGFALPHTRLRGVAAPWALLARLQRPMAFEAIDGRPVDIVVLLLLPEQGDHVAALAAVARAMREEAVTSAVRSARDPAALWQVLAA